MKICIVLGTRPEIIKGCSLIRYCQENNIDFFLIHTGQHYSYNLDKLFFKELELPQPKYNLEAGHGSFKCQLSAMLPKIKFILKEESPDIVLVIGDTNSVLAGGLAAGQLGIPLGHVEAGLRSDDIMMLEETHRIIVDNISDFLFTPTEMTKKNLDDEKHDPQKIFVTGNTIVDALQQNLEFSNSKSSILQDLGLEKSKYILASSHRQENVDFRPRLSKILESLRQVAEYHGQQIIWPIHPRTVKMLDKFGLSVPRGVRTTPLLGYLDFLQLQKNASFIVTDSGGMQEESCILKIPCVTLRDNTERPETLIVKSNMLVGVEPNMVVHGTQHMVKMERNWKNPYGDGKAAEKIIAILHKSLSQ